MTPLIEEFISLSRSFGVKPRFTEDRVYFDKVSLRVHPDIETGHPRRYVLTWPAVPRFEIFPRFVFRKILGNEDDRELQAFFEAAEPALVRGGFHRETFRGWEVTFARLAKKWRLVFTKVPVKFPTAQGS